MAASDEGKNRPDRVQLEALMLEYLADHEVDRELAEAIEAYQAGDRGPLARFLAKCLTDAWRAAT